MRGDRYYCAVWWPLAMCWSEVSRDDSLWYARRCYDTEKNTSTSTIYWVLLSQKADWYVPISSWFSRYTQITRWYVWISAYPGYQLARSSISSTCAHIFGNDKGLILSQRVHIVRIPQSSAFLPFSTHMYTTSSLLSLSRNCTLNSFPGSHSFFLFLLRELLGTPVRRNFWSADSSTEPSHLKAGIFQ